MPVVSIIQHWLSGWTSLTSGTGEATVTTHERATVSRSDRTTKTEYRRVVASR